MKQTTTSALAALATIAIGMRGAPVSASHIHGMDISYGHLAGNTYRIYLHAYLTTPYVPVDSVAVQIDALTTGAGLDSTVDLGGYGLQRAYYHVDHTFAGPGMYTIRASEQYRNGGILNIPGSQNVWICVEATLLITPGSGPNSSIVFAESQPPHFIPLYQVYVHNPQPSDPDGDSLAFEIAVPDGYGCVPVIDYTRPGDMPSGPGYIDTVETATGIYVWSSPQLFGQYVVAIRGEEWRNGVMVGSVTRDMTLWVATVLASPDLPGAAVPLLVPAGEEHVFTFTPTGAAWLQVVDVLGHVVHGRSVSHGAAVNLGHLPAGHYTIIAQSDRQRATQRWVKRH